MNTLLLMVANLLLATSCAMSQDQSDKTQRLGDAAKQAKISLGDAAQKASTVVGGTAVSAALEVASKDKPNASYRVVVLRDGKMFAVAVDAVSGSVGQPKDLTQDEGDDDDESHEKGDKTDK